MPGKIQITKERNRRLQTGETWSYIDDKCPVCGGHVASARELKACVICDWKNYEEEE